ncbi:hypothetical protein C9374_008286 [Naegleria lovaniensis]|uniref:Uncharacterized protein n=1 Tax=Naegleria lovaniensis TaxID=51637 RepID=A0AA88GJR7_NAELO|nr:uncharacterized protein C9374_008286 [Naegleria lovaniensis]KAG2378647.1 hypothetical protein C9374_008286 [Naegleria lovaniensis]
MLNNNSLEGMKDHDDQGSDQPHETNHNMDTINTEDMNQEQVINDTDCSSISDDELLDMDTDWSNHNDHHEDHEESLYQDQHPRRYIQKFILGNNRSEFYHPYDMVVDQHQELIFICDSGHHAIQVYDLSTYKFLKSIDLASDTPFYIDYDPIESAIVFGSNSHCLYKYSVFGKLIWKVGKYGDGNGEFSLPSGVYIDSKEKLIYLCDQDNHRIQVLNSHGEYVRQFGVYGRAPGQFNGPRNITASLDGQLIITDRNNHRVQIFTKNGQFVKTFGSYGCGHGQFNEPCSVLVEPKTGNIYVSDSFNDRIQVFSSNGDYIECIEGGLDYPLGISLNAKNGDLLVSEYSRCRVVILKDTKFESRMEEHFKRQMLYCVKNLNNDIDIVSQILEKEE